MFNVHKDSENHYRELLLLFRNFRELKTNLAKFDNFWRDAYLSENNNNEKLKKKHVYHFNISTKYDDE